jgi:hypothetical protein
MKVKNEEELANILGMAFASYANKVQNGLTGPFKSFLTGQDSVDVKISLTPDGSINMLSIDPIVELDAIAPIEPPVLEAVSPVEIAEDESDANVPELEAEQTIIEKEYPKPKRKRKV